MVWFEKAGCRSGAACRPCRTSEAFRQSVVDAGWSDAPSWRCPFGEDPPALSDGPGTKLARMLARHGIRHEPQCACHDVTLRMNASGRQWVREHADEIVEAMRAEASRRGLPFVSLIARWMVLWAAR